MIVFGVKLTCLTLFERGSWEAPGVVGADGRSLFRFGLLGLLIKDEIELGNFDVGFSGLAIGRRRIDFILSANLCVDSDLARPATLFIVADLTNPGVKAILEGERGIDGKGVPGCLALAARANDACVGVVIESKKFAERATVGVDGLLGICEVASLELGLAKEVS